MKKNINVLVVQNFITEDNPNINRERVKSLIHESIQANNINPDLILLPEFFTGPPWYFPNKKHLQGLIDETIPGETTNFFSHIAQKYKTHIVCGSLVEKEDDKYFNTSTLIGPNGDIIGKYRKVHRYASEIGNIEAGDNFPVFETEIGRIGIALCSDFWIMEVPRILSLKGADIIVVPANSLKQNINVTIEAILGASVLNATPIIYSSSINHISGLRNGRIVNIDFEGHSCIVTPKGVLSKAGTEETVLIGNLDMEFMHKLKQVDVMQTETISWGITGRRPELYQLLTNNPSRNCNH